VSVNMSDLIVSTIVQRAEHSYILVNKNLQAAEYICKRAKKRFVPFHFSLDVFFNNKHPQEIMRNTYM